MVADLSQFIVEQMRIILCSPINLSENVEYCLISRVAYKDGIIVPLTQTEAKLVEILVLNAGDIVSYEELINMIWGYGDRDIVKVNISKLRHKLGLNIRSVSGRGYMLEKYA